MAGKKERKTELVKALVLPAGEFFYRPAFI